MADTKRLKYTHWVECPYCECPMTATDTEDGFMSGTCPNCSQTAEFDSCPVCSTILPKGSF